MRVTSNLGVIINTSYIIISFDAIAKHTSDS